MLKFTFLTLILLLMAGWFAVITTVSEAKIIALWTFDEGQGKVVKDKSGNGNDGSVTGGKWIDGVFGKAFELDKDSFVEVENPGGTVFNLPEAFTVETLAYITDLTQCCGGIPRIMDSGDSAGWVMHPTKDGVGYKMYFWAYIGAWAGVSSQTTFEFSEEWHYFAATWDGKTMKMYVDGKLDGKQEASGKITPGDGPLRFSHEFADRVTIGAIDECLIADEALPEADVKKAVENGLKAYLSVGNRSKLAATWGRMKR